MKDCKSKTDRQKQKRAIKHQSVVSHLLFDLVSLILKMFLSVLKQLQSLSRQHLTDPVSMQTVHGSGKYEPALASTGYQL